MPKTLPPLPTGRELVAHVRDSVPRKGNSPPATFDIQRQRIVAAEAAARAEREQMRDLIRQAYGLGVPRNTLARWSGYTSRWITEILDGESS